MGRRGILISVAVAALLAVIAVVLIASEPGPTPAHRVALKPPCVSRATGETVPCSDRFAKSASGQPGFSEGSSGGGVVYDIAKWYLILFLFLGLCVLVWWALRRWWRHVGHRQPSAVPTSTPGTGDAPRVVVAEVEPNIGGLALAVVAAALAIISVFLPVLESSAFGSIEQNTLIQSGNGWLILGCAVGVLGAAYRVYARRTTTWAVFVLGAVILASAIYEGTGDRTKLHSTLPVAGESVTVNGSAAVGIYAAGVAGVLAMFSGLILAGKVMPSFDAGPRREAPSPLAQQESDLRKLRDSGVLREDEFQAAETRLLLGGLPEQLEKLVNLRDSGALTEDEFQAAKSRLLNR